MMDDRQISLLMQTDPQAALNRLITSYRNLVGKICRNILGDRDEDVEEAIADTFISIWKHADRFDPDKGSYKALLSVTARNTAINRWRQLKNTAVPLPELEETLADGTDALSALLLAEDAEELQSAINRLPEPNREILIRRCYLCQSVARIAERFNLSEKQISNRIYQSKQILREILIERSLGNE